MAKVNINNLQGNDAIHGVKQNRMEKAERTAVPAKDTATTREDKVEVSTRGAQVGQLVDELKQMPDVRQDRVSEIKEKIASGSYEPSSDDIADAILKDANR